MGLFDRPGNSQSLPPITFGTTPFKNVVVCRLCGALVYQNFHTQHSLAHDVALISSAEKLVEEEVPKWVNGPGTIPTEPTDGEAMGGA